MMGTGTFAEPTLEALLSGPDEVVGVWTQPDRDSGTKRGSTRQMGRGMKEIAQQAGVPVFQPENINTPEGIAQLRAVRPDLLVVAAYGQILCREILELAPLGAINVHASLLPRYRGAAPVAWAIARGETETGVTIIRLTTGLDAGDMLARETVTILPDETAGELEARLAPIGARLALQVIAQMKLGPVVGQKQDRTLMTKAPKLTKENGQIDFTAPAEQVQRHIRAMQPWPTAYTFLHRAGKPPMRLLLNRSHVVPDAPNAADAANPATPPLPAGSLLTAEAGKALEVVCGDGRRLRIDELQPAGKKRMTAAEFLRGHAIAAGDRLGPEVLA